MYQRMEFDLYVLQYLEIDQAPSFGIAHYSGARRDTLQTNKQTSHDETWRKSVDSGVDRKSWSPETTETDNKDKSSLNSRRGNRCRDLRRGRY